MKFSDQRKPAQQQHAAPLKEQPSATASASTQPAAQPADFRGSLVTRIEVRQAAEGLEWNGTTTRTYPDGRHVVKSTGWWPRARWYAEWATLGRQEHNAFIFEGVGRPIL